MDVRMTPFTVKTTDPFQLFVSYPWDSRLCWISTQGEDPQQYSTEFEDETAMWPLGVLMPLDKQ